MGLGSFFKGIGNALVKGVDSFFGGLPSAAAGVVGDLFGASQSQKQSKELMDYQFKLQQQGIADQNFYNSPAEQMKRLQAAGLNPNLVYGSGVDGNTSSAASPGIANRKVEFGNPMQDAIQQHNIQEQLELERIRTRNDAFESRARIHKLESETLGQMLDNAFNDRTLQTRIKAASQALINSIQQQKNAEANEAYTWSRTRNEDNKLEQIWAQTEYIKERTNLTTEQALTEPVKRSAIEAGVQVSQAQVKQIASYIAFLAAGTDLRKQQYKIQDVEYEAKKAYKEWRKNHPNASLTFDMIKEVLGIGGQIAPFIPGL